MVVGCIQYDVSHSKEDNFKQIEAALEKMKCDVVVLPELCLCGYLFPNQQELLKISGRKSSATTVLLTARCLNSIKTSLVQKSFPSSMGSTTEGGFFSPLPLQKRGAAHPLQRGYAAP